MWLAASVSGTPYSICRGNMHVTPCCPILKPSQRHHTLVQRVEMHSDRNASSQSIHVSINRELISSSTCARCAFALPASISFSITASTSVGGCSPSKLARFQRFRRAMPMQGCTSSSVYSLIGTPKGWCSTHAILPAHVPFPQHLLEDCEVLLVHSRR